MPAGRRAPASRASAIEVRSLSVGAAGFCEGHRGRDQDAGQDPFDLGVRTRNDVHRDELADASRGRRAGIGGRLDRADVAADQDGDVAGADVFLGDQNHVRGLDHRVGGLDGADEPQCFHHSQRFRCHVLRNTIIRTRIVGRTARYRPGTALSGLTFQAAVVRRA